MILQRILQLSILSALLLFSPQSHADDSTSYAHPTLKNFSQMYWALSKLDSENKAHIDNYLLINECEIFKDYTQDEFEWGEIRETTKNLIKSKKNEFPKNFEFVQPIKLAEFDTKTKTFDLYEPYKIQATRRFEVLSKDIFDNVCTKPYNHKLEGYPKGLIVELNRPFKLESIKTSTEVAQDYISSILQKNNEAEYIPTTKKDQYETRDAYLVMKVNLFSAEKENEQIREHELAKVLGVLERYEIYGDKDRELLLYSEDLKRKKERSPMEIEMKKRYQERLKKRMEEKQKTSAP